MNWKQLVALVKLRFRLTKNQIQKGGSVNGIIFMVLFVFVLFFSVSSFVSTAVGGVFFLRNLSPETMIFTWNVVTLIFIGASLFEFASRVQQNDVIEIDRLLHLPMTFQGAFFLNYASSLASLNMLMIAPCMIGLAIAMPFAKGWPTLIAVPLTMSFLFMVTALMYQSRGWFASIMKNKRTKGWMVIVIPFVFIGIFVGVTNLLDSTTAQDVIGKQPLGFLTSGIDSANQYGSLLPGIFGTLGMLAIGGASLFFAYRKSIKKYTGEDVAAAITKGPAKSLDWEKSRQFKKLPWTSEQASAIAMAGMKSLKRAPEIFAAVIPVAAALILGGPYLIGMEGYTIPAAIKDWLPMGAIFLTLIGFPAFLFSTYSYDRDGFRAYMLSPAPRKEILHGKNIAIGIPTVLCGWITLLILQIFVPQSLLWFLGSAVQVVATYLGMCLFGHLVSIFTPIGFKRGSMQPVNVKVLPAIAVYVGVLVGPGIATVPMFVAYAAPLLVEKFYGYQMGWLYLVLSLIQLGITCLIYRSCLEQMASWLWSREPEILDVVANIPE